jgi:pilus assembly protein CpaC
VLNFLEIAGGQQVMIQVRFAEVSRSASSQLGVSVFGDDGTFAFGAQNGPNASPIGAFANKTGGATLNPAINVFGAGQAGNFAFEYFVQAPAAQQPAPRAGRAQRHRHQRRAGQLPRGRRIPDPGAPGRREGGDTITIEYKQFGVKLNFLPTVLGDGKIRLKVEPEVSDLDYSKSVSLKGFTIPGPDEADADARRSS